jgi:hypothetical protein
MDVRLTTDTTGTYLQVNCPDTSCIGTWEVQGQVILVDYGTTYYWYLTVEVLCKSISLIVDSPHAPDA